MFSLLQLPYYGKTGVSTGVMLMNLTRMRDNSHVDWISENIRIFDRYQNVIKYGDQDILNIFFSKVRQNSNI